jgi:hypothetical protein
VRQLLTKVAVWEWGVSVFEKLQWSTLHTMWLLTIQTKRHESLALFSLASGVATIATRVLVVGKGAGPVGVRSWLGNELLCKGGKQVSVQKKHWK